MNEEIPSTYDNVIHLKLLTSNQIPNVLCYFFKAASIYHLEHQIVHRNTFW